MCGIALSTDYATTHDMLQVLQHRGRDGSHVASFRGLHLGQNRLAIVDLSDDAKQPLTTGASTIAFNGEIFNEPELFVAMRSDANKIKPRVHNEIHVIEAIMRRHPAHFERFLDGYYGIVRIDRGRARVVVSRDIVGVVPLYYRRYPFAVASEHKALGSKWREVMPGETLTFSLQGKLLKRRQYDPISLHLDEPDVKHIHHLFERAVVRRVLHSDVKVCVALSGGLDSSLVLAQAARVRSDVEAVTVCLNSNSDELENARRLCSRYNVRHHIVVLDDELIARHRQSILYHLEDPKNNPIKYAAMIRNYFTAMHAPGTVVLCGEGADEVGCGYPPHLARRGLELEWKSYSTLRSMRAINLDRVNKGGLAFTREFRTPFLDRALVLYLMGCRKRPNKEYFREMAKQFYNLPHYILSKPKYGGEEKRLWNIVQTW